MSYLQPKTDFLNMGPLSNIGLTYFAVSEEPFRTPTNINLP